MKNPETLQQSDTVRERIAEGVNRIKSELDTMIVQRPTRKASGAEESEVS